MNILYIIPPNLQFDYFINPEFNDTTMEYILPYDIAEKTGRKTQKVGKLYTEMPLGILSISSYIKEFNHDLNVELLDFNIVLNKINYFNDDSFDKFFSKYISENVKLKPDIIGISAIFVTQYQNMLILGDVCKKNFPDAFIAAGGGMPTNAYSQIFNETSSFDALCYGEGEIPWKELLEAENKQRYCEESNCWITKNSLNKKLEFKLIMDLDEIPLLDYGLCDFEDYSINPSFASSQIVTRKLPNFLFMSSRGCVNQCTFCSSHSVHGRKMRYYSLERIKEDLNTLQNKYHVEAIVMEDDHFMMDKDRALKIMEIIKDMHLKVVFQNALAMYALDKPFLIAIQNSGVDILQLPIESGSDHVLKDLMHKPLNRKIIKRVTEECYEIGLSTNGNILIGMPGETKEDIEDSINFLKTLPVEWYYIYAATPLFGSDMYKTCMEKGYIDEQSALNASYKRAIVNTEDFSTEWLEEKTYLMNLELNFINNSSFRMGNYQIAISRFEYVTNIVKDHAFALYMLGLCFERLEMEDKAKKYISKAYNIINSSSQWNSYFDYFKKDIFKIPSKYHRFN